ncbi:amino acid adenylation domain-containing protein [Anabaena sp. UHCC 0253]|uniref:non-ribosomal peptide synthetase family protein n=1 Tax=Anabaena sp. UHCC 0253 TaxID=2590019 RepID=UPI001445BA02|nr:non-ribosomal peptide synthetase [Anabaena sp. UHCC 0253]MTJ53551.1 amino acid adenylation domain-containing protein [Anabaena sp. UHCC 0253]
MSNLLQKIAELSPEKRQLLLQKLNQQKGKAAPAKIQPQSRDTQTFPLSFAQQRLWFFSQLEPESSAYNIPAAIQLTGNLNVLALENSINQIVHRHHILRTNFQVINGEPVQMIRAETNLQTPIIDLQNIPENTRETEAIRLAKLEAEKPFNLEKDLLLRVNLLRLSETDHVILFTMHHIISDGWSTGILIRELTTFYKAFDSNQKCNLPELPIQYIDFAVWQRQYLQGDILQTQLNYWKQQLSGNLPILELPTDRPRPAIQTDRGTSQSFTLFPSLTAALKNLSQQEEVTLFMILLAAFKVLLYRYTQQEDILVGTPIANRNRSEIEGLIGFFINTLVIRSDLEGNPTFQQLLTQIKKTTLAAYNHQDLPFEQLVEELQPERDLSHSSLFQVMFILQNAPTEVLHLPDLTLKPLQVEKKTANFDLTLSMLETETGLRGSLEYNTDLFDDDRITQMLAHFQTLLAEIVLYHQQNISELSLLTTSERQQILLARNHHQISIPQQCIHQLFEAQVTKNPDAIAVVFEEKILTYRELNQRANQLANYLRKQGVKPEVLVGICLERSLELVVAVLGILKAGGAYLPIDPAYPQERLTYMLTDAQVSIILTQKQLLAVLPDENIQTICIDSDWQKITNESLENPLSQVNINHLAYVIYTSGSTGKSKGVMIEHRSLVNAYFAWEEAYKLTAITAHLQMASFSFDVFSGDLVRALCSGAKLVISPRQLLLEPEKLYQLMLQEKVECAEFVPGVLRNLIQYLEQTQQRLDFLKLLICGSDSWYIQEYDKFCQYCGDKTRLINSFGLTEATIDSTYFETETTNLSPVAKDKLVPIGKPFTNTQIYILDQYLQPLPVGISGEIYIGGAGLARGYLHKPELTASKFIPNRFCEETGSFLYKTGDLGRWLQDVNIELIGRIDNQVKLRGFRIELGEIEAILSKHPIVKEAVVIVREDHHKQQQLVAYIVSALADFNHINSTTFQEFLKQQLPNYMIPSAFMILEFFPLTPNGKIDRRALPKPEYQELQTAFVAPQTQTELTLAQIWAEILKVEKVGINDNFFELGGNSLLTTKLMLKIQSTLQIDFPLRLLFESPTIASLAVYLDKIIKSESIDTLIPENLIDWDQETILDSQIYPLNTYQKSAKPPQAILLTGATGFLGAFLLWELLQQTQADIYCLVRARDIVSAKKKIQKTLDSYLIGNESFYQRIIPVIGDLSQPYLGLNKNEFQDLANQVDVIYHNGAWVNHIYPYSVLKPANVLGTQEILKLACLGKTKPVHFVSTTSIFSQSSISGIQVITEADNSDTYPVKTNGYVQTKWVNEKLLVTARNKGIPISIYRIGRVSGHSETGVFNINDLLYKLIIGCIQLGTVPNRDIQEDIMPVDYVSKAIVYLSTQEKSLDKAFHLFNNQVVHTDNLLRVIHSYGYQVKQVPYQDWRSQLINVVGDLPEHPLYPLIPLFSAKTSQGKSEKSDTLQFDSQNVITGLADSSIICPDIDDQLLNTYISYLAKQGFIH